VPTLRRSSGPVDPEAARRALMARVRSTGNQGSRIAPHRAIATVRITRTDVALAVLLTIALTALYVASVNFVGRFWTAIFRVVAGPLALGGVAQRVTLIASAVHVSVPYFTRTAGPPSVAMWWIVLVVTVAVMVVSLMLPPRLLPLAYALRFLAAIQASALAFFGLARGSFPYDLAVYISGMLLIAAALIGIVPLILGLTFYVMDVRWSQKILLTAMIMGHLVVFVPLQYALQAYVVAHGSLIFLPACFIILGTMPEVMIVIALYGWGMSWAPAGSRGRRQ
jgi:hypothetical protein